MQINYEIHNGTNNTEICGSLNLSPCPFCGGSSIELENTHTASCWVQCSCGAEIHGEYFCGRKGKEGEKHFELAIKSAADKWNKRARLRGLVG